MGCGESKHTVATTEPIKKSASRSSSRRVQTPDVATEPVKKSASRSSSKRAQNPDVATEPVKKSASRSSSKRIQNPDQNKPTTTIDTSIVENGVGVIPGEPFVVQKPTMEGPDAGKKDEKKAVVAVTHDRTTSKESQASDNFSENGIEDRSEYESPQLDADRGSNEVVGNVVVIEKVKTKEEKNDKKESIIVVEEFTKMESGIANNQIQGITGEEMKQQEEKLEKKEGMTQKLDDQVVVAKKDVQETKPILLEDGTTVATEDIGDAKNATDTVVIAEEVMEPKTAMAETEITVEQETKIMETDEVKPTELEVRTVSEEKIKDSNT